MPDPAIAATTAFGRPLEDLFTAAPERPQAAVVGGTVPAVVGTALVEVPLVSGPAVQVEDAQKTLRNARLVPAVQFVETAGTENTVKRQEPDVGSFLRPGDPVKLYVIVPPPPSPVDELVARVREAIQEEELVKKTEVETLVKDLASKSDITAAVKDLATRNDVTSATAVLQREDEAKRRFDALMKK